MVSTKYIQAIVHSSSPEKKKREKNILQSQTVTTVKGIVRETVMAIVNRKIQKQVSVSHKQKSKWQNLYAPHKQARYSELLAVRQLWDYSVSNMHIVHTT